MENVSSEDEQKRYYSYQQRSAQTVRIMTFHSHCTSRNSSIQDNFLYQQNFINTFGPDSLFQSLQSETYWKQLENDKQQQSEMDAIALEMLNETFDSCLRSSTDISIPSIQLRDYIEIIFKDRNINIADSTYPNYWDYNKSQLKYSQRTLSEWTPQIEYKIGSVFQRNSQYKVPPKNMLMSKKSSIIEHHKLLIEPTKLTFDTKVTAQHVPFCDNFYILNREIITKNDNSIHIEFLQKIVFNKKFALQSMIKSITSKETKAIQEKFINQPLKNVLQQEYLIIDNKKQQLDRNYQNDIFFDSNFSGKDSAKTNDDLAEIQDIKIDMELIQKYESKEIYPKDQIYNQVNTKTKTKIKNKNLIIILIILITLIICTLAFVAIKT